MKQPLTVYLLPFIVRYPFTVLRYLWLKAKSEGKVRGKEPKVNGFAGGTW